MQTRVTLLTAQDIKPYRELMLEGFAQAPDAFTSTAEERAAEPESWWLKRIADSTGLNVAFGAFHEQDLVGTVALEFYSKPKTKHKAHLIGMYVRASARGAGIGKKLVCAALDYAQARQGIKIITLTVTEGNHSAINLYQGVGFTEFGLEPMAILTGSGYKAKVHMWLRLQASGVAA